MERARLLAGLQSKLVTQSRQVAIDNLENQKRQGSVTAEEKAALVDFGEPTEDMVNNPPHYQIMEGVEVIDVRKGLMDKIPSNVPFGQVDDWSRSWEYITRMWGKNGLEDAKKARFYLNRLIDAMEGEE